MDIREDLSALLPPRFGTELEERRNRVIDWLKFIRDFGRVDTTLLISRAGTDDDFLDAVEAIAATGGNAATVYDAVRSFAVQLLLREVPLHEQDTPAPLPAAARISPHSVPVELLRECFNAGELHDFIPARLHINTWQGTLSDYGTWTQHLGRAQMALLTTIWCRAFPMPSDSPTPALPPDVELRFLEVSSNRGFRIPLLPTLIDYVPLFVLIAPSGGFDIRLELLEAGQSPLVKVFVEGWTYECY